MKFRHLVPIALVAVSLAACSSDPFPDLRLKPESFVPLSLGAGRIEYRTLYGAQVRSRTLSADAGNLAR